MEYRFCPVCGDGLELLESGEYPRCSKGHYTFSPWQNVGVAAVLCKDRLVLLEQRAFGSAFGLWALPGGMLEFGEQTESALTREVFEETGLNVEVGSLLGVMGGNKVCIIFYEANLIGGDLAKSDESLEVKWFSFEDIPWDKLAFPRHKQVLQEWILKHS
jgi:ADP-ribose pyrophosphatase YjhB (NUDIX family)